MEILIATTAGGLFGLGIYLVLRRGMVKMVLGLVLLSQALNLVILAAGGLVRGRVPIIAGDAAALVEPYPDPLPQALILTAIVISFGVLAFALVLVHQARRVTGTDDSDALGIDE